MHSVELPTSDEEVIRRVKKLMEKGDARAFHLFAGYYAQGIYGMPVDLEKSNQLLLKAGELGCAMAYYTLGNCYHVGRGVERDMKKAKQYFELAAMGGHVEARHNFGCLEGLAGNDHQAMKHFMISAKAGFNQSLPNVKIGFKKGILTKVEYEATLRAYQKSIDDMKSEWRGKAKTGLTITH